MPGAYAPATPVRLRPFCFAGGPPPRARSSSKRYTDEINFEREMMRIWHFVFTAIYFAYGIEKPNAKVLELRRLNYLQCSIARADVIVLGSPEVKKHIPPVTTMDTDIRFTSPDTIYFEISNPRYFLGVPTIGKIKFKLVAHLNGPSFKVTKEMIFFLCRLGSDYYVVDFKKTGNERFALENEIIDTNQIIEKGMVGHLSINRDWNTDWTKSVSTEFSLAELKEYIQYIRNDYRLVPFCFHTPIDISVYFFPEKEKKLFRGELGVLNDITEMMVRKSNEKKQWLEENATRVDLKNDLCKSIRYD